MHKLGLVAIQLTAVTRVAYGLPDPVPPDDPNEPREHGEPNEPDEPDEPDEPPQEVPRATPHEVPHATPIVVARVVEPRHPAISKPALGVTYDKGIVIASPDGAYELRVSFRNQLRVESTRPTEGDSQFVSRVIVPRSRLLVEGRLFGGNTRYRLDYAFTDRGNFSFIKDVYAERTIPNTSAWVRIGQWKRPFDRQELMSDFGLEYPERANTSDFMIGGSRDLGVALHNDYEKSPEGLEWAAGVFDTFSGGNDRPKLATTCSANPATNAIDCLTPTPSTFPTDFSPAVVLHTGWNVGGIKGYSQADLEGGPLRLAFGLDYKIDLANFAKAKETSVGNNESHELAAAVLMKVEGFDLLLDADLVKLKTASWKLGALVQAGYFVLPKSAEICGRVSFAPATTTRTQLEGRAAFNWFWQGHSWKWSTDLGFVKFTGTDPMTMTTDKPDVQLRSMVQLLL